MSGMIRRLRWKIVGISMLFVTLVRRYSPE